MFTGASSTASAGRSVTKRHVKDLQKSAAALGNFKALPVVRSVVTPAFFDTKQYIPYLQQFDHLLAVVTGYVVGVLFEEIATCFFPSTFVESHTWWLAASALVFAIFESWAICAKSISRTAPLIIAALAALFSLALIAAGELGNFVRFHTAFEALDSTVNTLMVQTLDMHNTTAASVAPKISLLIRVLTALLAGTIAAASMYPALQFSRIDYNMHSAYVQSDEILEDDPFALPRPRPVAMLLVTLDYVLPCIVLLLWSTSLRTEEHSKSLTTSASAYASHRLVLMLLCVAVRLLCARIRLQRYLDTAIDAYRAFWSDKSVRGLVPAGDRLKLQVVSVAYNLTMMGMASIVSPVMTLALALAAKRNGAVRLGICPVRHTAVATNQNVFIREIVGFLAWMSVLSYALFSLLSLLYLVVTKALDPSHLRREKKVQPPLKSSERRRQRRLRESMIGTTGPS